MKTLETKRLVLRNFNVNDLDDLYEYAKVEGVGEFAGWKPHTSKDITKTILDSFIKNDEVYALVYKENNKVIGSLGIHNRTMDSNYQANNQKEIGYVLSKEYWGNGLMSEACNEVIRHCFEDLNIDVLWCGHFSFNDRSRRVIEKCGFKYYGEGKYEATQLNQIYDEAKYIYTKKEYKKG